MGQSVVTVMYGIKTTEALMTNGEYFWDNYKGPAEKRLSYDDAPRSAYEGDATGFPVATGPAYDDDEDYLGDSCLLADFENMHAEAISRARKKWEKFAAWALKEHGRKLPPAALWITTDERA